jgi:4-hydroxy-tetrahydrodipicolinate synthase
MTLFTGMSAFPITPTDAHGRVDTDGLCRLLMRWKAAQVSSLGLFGSTGSYAYLTRSERQRAIAAAADCIDGDIPLIVGVGALRTDDAVGLTQDAGRSGADALLLAPVSYTPLTQEEVYQHFYTVAAATDLPICIYNNPGTTHFQFSTELLERLAQVPNISAVKMPLPTDGDFARDLANLRTKLPDDFAIGYSGDWGCTDALLAGADTWYSVVGGTLPEMTMKLATAAMSGQSAEAQKIDAQFASLWALFQEYGSLRVVYTIAKLLDLTQAVPPRPILPLSDTAEQQIIAALAALEVPV